MISTPGVSGFVPDFLALAKTQPERLFARFAGETVSFEWLMNWSGAVAQQFRRRGLRRGDRVAVMQRNSQSALAIL